MKGTLPFYIVGVCLLLASVVQVVLFRALKRSRNEPPANLHEACERNIANLESKVTRLEEQNTTWGIVVGARDADIKILQTKLDGFKWLDEIARDEAETLYSFVSVADCQIAKHELVRRSDPYIEFSATIWNRSIYDITIQEMVGSMAFNGRELTGKPTWKEEDRVILRNNTRSFIFRQSLSSEDVTHILNGRAHFDLNQLKITAHSKNESIDVKPQVLDFDKVAPNNDELLEKYPKLDFKMASAFYDWELDFRKGPRNQPCYVTLYLTITNHRNVSIMFETIRMTLSVNGKDYTSFAEDHVYERRSTSEQGIKLNQGERSDNLNKNPLTLIEDKPARGSLQFVFEGLDYMVLLMQNLKDSLNDSPFVLLLTDTNDEKHIQRGKVQFRDKELFDQN